MLISAPPSDWRQLQEDVARVLRECGMLTHIEHAVETGRGGVEVDVYAKDMSTNPASLYLIECKSWNSRVHQNVVHGFRTIVQDCGANFGLIVSMSGFQRGAIEAAGRTNIKLFDWGGFSNLFCQRWIEKFMISRIREACDPLIEYTEPVNSRTFRKFQTLDQPAQDSVRRLRHQYQMFGMFLVMLVVTESLYSQNLIGILKDSPSPSAIAGLDEFAPSLSGATNLREFTDGICERAQAAIADFDSVFGGRA